MSRWSGTPWSRHRAAERAAYAKHPPPPSRPPETRDPSAGPADAWNARYVAYARAHGADPDVMLTRDRERWPGGVMAGFILWIGERWAAWDGAHGYGPSHVRGQEEHKAFTAWLMAEAVGQ